MIKYVQLLMLIQGYNTVYKTYLSHYETKIFGFPGELMIKF